MLQTIKSRIRRVANSEVNAWAFFSGAAVLLLAALNHFDAAPINALLCAAVQLAGFLMCWSREKLGTVLFSIWLAIFTVSLFAFAYIFGKQGFTISPEIAAFVNDYWGILLTVIAIILWVIPHLRNDPPQR